MYNGYKKRGERVKILLVEDDLSLAENIAAILKTEGYDVVCAADGDEGLYYIENNSCDLVILDRMLPEKNGIEILKIARSKNIAMPVLMLSAMGTVADRISGLDAGADDYLTKPFEYGELLARVRALIRRPGAIETTEVLRYADVSFDTHTRLLCGPAQSLSLTKREGAMLELFLRSGGEVITKQTIFSRVWGPDSDTDESNVATYIHFLRRRLAAAGSTLQVQNHRGIGFGLRS